MVRSLPLAPLPLRLLLPLPPLLPFLLGCTIQSMGSASSLPYRRAPCRHRQGFEVLGLDYEV